MLKNINNLWIVIVIFVCTCQPVTEASYVNIPVIAFCNTDSALHHVDVAIPCNNKGAHAVGLMWWLLAREVLRMRGSISRLLPWEVMPDLYFYRDPEEVRMTKFLNNINSWWYLRGFASCL